MCWADRGKTNCVFLQKCVLSESLTCQGQIYENAKQSEENIRPFDAVLFSSDVSLTRLHHLLCYIKTLF